MAVAEDLAQFLLLLEDPNTKPMYEMTPEEARESFRLLCVQMRSPGMAIEGVDVREDEVAGRPVRVYRAQNAAEGVRPTLAFIHGGGFVIGDLDTHDPLCRMIARDAGAVVVSIDYPLAPEHRFPAAVEHCGAAVREIAERVSEYGGGPVFVGGDSAGGNLSAIAAQELRDLPLAGQVLIYPAVDAGGTYPSQTENGEGYFLDTPTIEWFSSNYAPDGQVDPALLTAGRVAPLHGELAGVAPALVVTAQYDPLRDEGVAYAEALRQAGVEVTHVQYDDQIHGFANMDHLAASSRAAVTDLVQRMRHLFEKGSPA